MVTFKPVTSQNCQADYVLEYMDKGHRETWDEFTFLYKLACVGKFGCIV